MDAVARHGRVRVFFASAVSFLLHPRRAALCALAAILAALALLEFSPGVPDRFRPFGRYKHWRAQGFFKNAALAHERGDLNLARLSLSSALELNPALSPARLHLARLHVEENRFADAAEQARLAGMDGGVFVHDMLFYSGRFDELFVHCAHRLLSATDNSGVWLQSALMIAPLTAKSARAHVADLLNASSHASALFLKGVFFAIDQNPAALADTLAQRTTRAVLNPAEVLLGLELFMRAGDPAQAWVWLQRHRSQLTEFDARCADYRVESSRDPQLARGILESIPRLPMNESRWLKLTAIVAASGDTRAATTAATLLSNHLPAPSPSVSVSAWALLLACGKEDEALAWEKAFQRTGAAGLPLLVGRALAQSDRQTRSQAVRLLSSSAPLPREMISALLLR